MVPSPSIECPHRKVPAHKKFRKFQSYEHIVHSSPRKIPHCIPDSHPNQAFSFCGSSVKNNGFETISWSHSTERRRSLTPHNHDHLNDSAYFVSDKTV